MRMLVALLALATACAFGNLWDGTTPDASVKEPPDDSDPCADVHVCGSVGDPPMRTGHCQIGGDGRPRCECISGYQRVGNSQDEREPCVVDVCAAAENPCGLGSCERRAPTTTAPNGLELTDGTQYAGAAFCQCPAGTKKFGSGDLAACYDIIECSERLPDGGPLANCDRNAYCTNTVGSYTCTCECGFVGDGGTCIDLCEPDDVCGTYEYKEPDAQYGTVRAGYCNHVSRGVGTTCGSRDVYPDGIYCDCKTGEGSGFVRTADGKCTDLCDFPSTCGSRGKCTHEPPRTMPGLPDQFAGWLRCECEPGSHHADRYPLSCDAGNDCECGPRYAPLFGYCVRPDSPCVDDP